MGCSWHTRIYYSIGTLQSYFRYQCPKIFPHILISMYHRVYSYPYVGQALTARLAPLVAKTACFTRTELPIVSYQQSSPTHCLFRSLNQSCRVEHTYQLSHPLSHLLSARHSTLFLVHTGRLAFLAMSNLLVSITKSRSFWLASPAHLAHPFKLSL